MSAITNIEDAFAAHWSVFGRWPKGELHDERGLLWFETPIAHLPYNGVIRTRIEGDTDTAIGELLQRFRLRGVEFFWLVHPSARPADLGDRLAASGVNPVETAIGMSLELDGWEPTPTPPAVAYREVLDEDELLAYHRLTVSYWELGQADAAAVEELQRALEPGRTPGHRYLAFVDGVPVGKGYVSLAGPPGVASLYGMSVLPEARGRGIAGGLTAVLLGRARDAGCSRAVLHSSELAVGVYRRAGFVEQCRLPFHATTAVWSHER
jgi:ribosomal protein S18 acetylase RimI-like enzyme